MFDTDGAPQINDDANFNNNNSSSSSSFSFFFFLLIESKCSMIRLHNKYEPSHAVKELGTMVVVSVSVFVCAVVVAVIFGGSFVLSFGVSSFDSVPKLEPPLVSGATGGGGAVVPNEKGDAFAGVPKVLVVAAGDPKENDDAVLAAGVLLADVPNGEVPRLLPTLPTLVVVAGGDPKAPNDDAVLAGAVPKLFSGATGDPKAPNDGAVLA
jgi:hypothetical protein